jgi:hypothetical protein
LSSGGSPETRTNATPTIRSARPLTYQSNSTATAERCDVDHTFRGCWRFVQLANCRKGGAWAGTNCSKSSNCSSSRGDPVFLRASHRGRTEKNNASTTVLFRTCFASAELAASKTSNPAARRRSAFARRNGASPSTTRTTGFPVRTSDALGECSRRITSQGEL